MATKRLAAAVCTAALAYFSGPRVCPAAPTQLEPANRLAAQTWRAVDELFYDRTFNGQDWFQMRQSVVKRRYSSDAEAYQALEQMLSRLGDKYTRFLTPAQYSAVMNSAVGELVGVGVELANGPEGNSEGILIPRVEDSSPAMEAGVRKGDVLVNVDGTETRGISAEETALLLRGKEGSKASLRVLREGKTLDFTIARRPIKLKGVTSSLVSFGGKNAAVINVRSFASSTASEVQRAFEKLHSDGKAIDAIVMDLRNNGGGLLQGAVETANVFLPPGKVVVFVVNKDGQPKVEQTLPSVLDSADPLLPDLSTPMFVLVNGNTASAAEVLAAALRENGRAKLVGEQTFGKGVIQTLEQVGSTGAGVAVTIAKYETPSHNDINMVRHFDIILNFLRDCAVERNTRRC